MKLQDYLENWLQSNQFLLEREGLDFMLFKRQLDFINIAHYENSTLVSLFFIQQNYVTTFKLISENDFLEKVKVSELKKEKPSDNV